MEDSGAAGCADTRRPAAAASGPTLPVTRDVGLALTTCVAGPFAAATGAELDAPDTACGAAAAVIGADVALPTTDVTGAELAGLVCRTAPAPYAASGAMEGAETCAETGADGVLKLLADAGAAPCGVGLVAGARSICPPDSAFAES